MDKPLTFILILKSKCIAMLPYRKFPQEPLLILTLFSWLIIGIISFLKGISYLYKRFLSRVFEINWGAEQLSLCPDAKWPSNEMGQWLIACVEWGPLTRPRTRRHLGNAKYFPVLCWMIAVMNCLLASQKMIKLCVDHIDMISD